MKVLKYGFLFLVLLAIVFFSKVAILGLGHSSTIVRNVSFVVVDKVLDWRFQETFGYSTLDFLLVVRIMNENRGNNKESADLIIKAACSYTSKHEFDPFMTLENAAASNRVKLASFILHRGIDREIIKNHILNDTPSKTFGAVYFMDFLDLMTVDNPRNDGEAANLIKQYVLTGDLPKGLVDPCSET